MSRQEDLVPLVSHSLQFITLSGRVKRVSELEEQFSNLVVGVDLFFDFGF